MAKTEHTPTGLKCQVCNKEFLTGDKLNTDAIRQLNRHDGLVKACKATLNFLSASSKLDWDGQLTEIVKAALYQERSLNMDYEQQEQKNTEFVVSAFWAGIIISTFLLLCFAIKGCYCFSVH